MRVILILAGLSASAGCNTPGPAFRGIDPVRISVGKSTFDVRVDGTRAQAIRLNPEWAPRREAVAPRAVAAIEKVSGCTAARLDGDQVVIVARLDCGDGPPPAPRAVNYTCRIDPYGGGYADLVCEPEL